MERSHNFPQPQQPCLGWNKIFCDVNVGKRLALSQSQTDRPVFYQYVKHLFLKFQTSSHYYLCLIPTQLTDLGTWHQCWGPSRFSIMLVMLEVVVHEPQFGHHSKNNIHKRVMTHTCAFFLSESTEYDLFKSPQIASISSYFSCWIINMHID